MASLSDFFFGSSDKLSKVPTGTPQQQDLHNLLLQLAQGMGGQGGGYQNAQNYYNKFLTEGTGNQAYQNFAAPFMNQFNEQILPQIAERFAGAGALSSSGFGQALGGAGAGLQAQLAKLFADLQSNAAEQQTGQFNQLATKGLGYEPFAYNKEQGSSGILGNLLGGAGMALSGPLGNMIGQGITSLFKKPAMGAQGRLGSAGLFGGGGMF
jgi:hypothetical protein